MARTSTGPLRSLGSVVTALASFVTISMLTGVLAAGVAIPVVGAGGAVARNGVEFFDELPEDLTVGSLSQQSRILWSDGSPMATFYYENRILVPLSSVAPVMRQAVLAIEDSRFYEHNGVDAKGIGRAFVNNLRGGDTQGASTLTQQWIKNVLLDQARAAGDEAQVEALTSTDQGRKVREIKLALAVEEQYTKDQILENYLNIALFGDNQYGVQTAAQHYFGKQAGDLTLQDAALLAGMISSPTFNDPVDYPEQALRRRGLVLERMLGLGMITQVQFDEANAVPLEAQLNVQTAPNGCATAGNAGFFCDFVVKTILNDPVFGADIADRQKLLYRGGLVITTTLDRGKQQLAQDAIWARVPSDAAAAGGVGQALSSVEATTGRIVAMAQNRTYDPNQDATTGGISVNWNTDKVYGGSGGFQVGSTYKPFTLANWLANGHSLFETVNANARTYSQSRDFTSSCQQLGGTWTPGNSEGRDKGDIPVLQATYNSVNLAYASMASELDLCAIRDTAASMGVHRADGAELGSNPSSILGDNEIAPLTMASAFATFANNGIACKPLAIDSIVDAAGTPLPRPEPDCKQAIAPEVANNVAFALTQTVERGTARRGGGIGRPSAGKTGTTNDSTETWFVGFTPGQLSTAVWTGTPYQGEIQSLNGARVGGRRYGSVFGATLSLPTFNQYMRQALSGVPVAPFGRPTQQRVQADDQDRVPVPDVAGQGVDAAEEAMDSADLRAAVRFQEDSALPEGTVVRTRPAAGTSVEPGTTVSLVVSNGSQAGAAPPADAGEGGNAAGPGGAVPGALGPGEVDG